LTVKWSWQRVTLAVVDGFAAISAIGGGYAVMVGAIKPGPDLAAGPFSWLISDYFVAGEILLIVIGGTALVALVATLLSRTAGAGFSATAGLVMMGWIVSEVFIVGTHWLQLVYFAVGLAMLAVAVTVEPAHIRATAHRLHLA
jgi:hypothetical protein